MFRIIISSIVISIYAVIFIITVYDLVSDYGRNRNV